MLTLLLAELNELGPVDVGFFIVCGVLIVICILIYFLIPIINKKQYQEMRDNLKKREVAFKAGLKDTDSAEVDASAGAEETPNKKE